MSQTLTIDDIWKLFQETNRLFQESKLEAKQDTERQAQEAERRAQETERRDREAERRAQDAEREFQEIRRMMQETDRRIDRVSKQIGHLGGSWGEFVEGLVAPACDTLFAQRGIPVHKVSRQVRAKLPGNRHIEIDLLVVNTDAVVLVEVKSKLKHDDVWEHLTRVAEFKEFFPEYAAKRVMGAVAGIVIEENVDRFAMNKGFFVIVQSGDGVQLANDEAFVPCTW